MRKYWFWLIIVLAFSCKSAPKAEVPEDSEAIEAEYGVSDEEPVWAEPAPETPYPEDAELAAEPPPEILESPDLDLSAQEPLPELSLAEVWAGAPAEEARAEEALAEPQAAIEEDLASVPETVIPLDEPSEAPLSLMPEPAADRVLTSEGTPPEPSDQWSAADRVLTSEGSPPEPAAGQAAAGAETDSLRASPPQTSPMVQTAPPQSSPVLPQNTEPARPAEPPPIPPNIRPVEPAVPPLAREQVPVPVDPLPELPARILPSETREEPEFSRIVRVIAGQLVEIPFRGTGWVFLGELGSRRGISYDSRRLDPEGQSFIFRAETPGTYILKFYKQDFLRDYIINDHVQVIVGEAADSTGIGWFNAPIDRGRIVAEPRWPLIEGSVPPAESNAQTAPLAAQEMQNAAAMQNDPNAEDSRIIQDPIPSAITGLEASQPGNSPGIAQSSPENPSPPVYSGPDEYVRRAREEFDAGRVESALSILDKFRELYPLGTDEAWLLYGQLLEANSPGRDIRLALDYYRRLVRDYPQSPRVQEAQRRIAYLERFYFNLR